MAKKKVQWGVQVRVNANTSGAYWELMDEYDFPLAESEDEGWDVVEEAVNDGYGRDYLRLVKITTEVVKK